MRHCRRRFFHCLNGFSQASPNIICRVTSSVNLPRRPPGGAQFITWLDSSAIKKDVGWEQELTLEEGLKEMVEWGRTYLPQLREMSTDYILRA